MDLIAIPEGYFEQMTEEEKVFNLHFHDRYIDFLLRMLDRDQLDKASEFLVEDLVAFPFPARTGP